MPKKCDRRGAAQVRARASWCVALCLLVLPAGTAAPADRSADPFRSETGRFAVRLPAPPRHSSTSQATLAGRIESAEYRVEAGKVELRVELHDVPAVASFLLSDDALLARAQRDLLADEQAEGPLELALEFQGHPAREVRYRLGGGDGRDGRALLVLVGTRLYIAAALQPAAAPADPAVDRFFASFEVWER